MNWNHILGMYSPKNDMQTLVIEQEEWAHLSDPTLLSLYWEPTKDPEDFHHTFAMVLCQTQYHDCEYKSHRERLHSVGCNCAKTSTLSRHTFLTSSSRVPRFLQGHSDTVDGMAPLTFPTLPWMCIMIGTKSTSH